MGERGGLLKSRKEGGVTLQHRAIVNGSSDSALADHIHSQAHQEFPPFMWSFVEVSATSTRPTPDNGLARTTPTTSFNPLILWFERPHGVSALDFHSAALNPAARETVDDGSRRHSSASRLGEYVSFSSY